MNTVQLAPTTAHDVAGVSPRMGVHRLRESVDGRVVLWAVDGRGAILGVEVVEVADECMAVERLCNRIYGDDVEPPCRLQLLTAPDTVSGVSSHFAAAAPHALLDPAALALPPCVPPVLQLYRCGPHSASSGRRGEHVRRVNLTPTS